MSVIAERRGLSETQVGIMLGLITVAIWGAYLAMNRFGTASGLTMADLALVRYGIGTLVLLPWLITHSPATLGGLGWRHGIIMTMILGPSFMYLAVGGYYFAPLAHGAVFQPSGLIVSGLVLGAFVLGETIRAAHLVGIVIILAGLSLVAGPALFQGGNHAFLGDILFFIAGSSWGLFTVLAKRWRSDPIAATAAVSILSGVVFVPLFIATDTFERLAALPWPSLIAQVVVQGVLAAVVATITFTKAA